MDANRVQCAIFYVDPESTGVVRYRGDQTDPTPTVGLPLHPGKTITVAGEGNVRNARFITESGAAVVHCMYYDRVDVVDLGISGSGDADAVVRAVQALAEQVTEVAHLLRQIRFGTAKLADVELAAVG